MYGLTIGTSANVIEEQITNKIYISIFFAGKWTTILSIAVCCFSPEMCWSLTWVHNPHPIEVVLIGWQPHGFWHCNDRLGWVTAQVIYLSSDFILSSTKKFRYLLHVSHDIQLVCVAGRFWFLMEIKTGHKFRGTKVASPPCFCLALCNFFN